MTNEAAKQLEKWVTGSDETLANFRFRVQEALDEERATMADEIRRRLAEIDPDKKAAAVLRILNEVAR